MIAGVAQFAERLFCKQRVVGSIPTTGPKQEVSAHVKLLDGAITGGPEGKCNFQRWSDDGRPRFRAYLRLLPDVRKPQTFLEVLRGYFIVATTFAFIGLVFGLFGVFLD